VACGLQVPKREFAPASNRDRMLQGIAASGKRSKAIGTDRFGQARLEKILQVFKAVEYRLAGGSGASSLRLELITTARQKKRALPWRRGQRRPPGSEK
jgi:hypothetical protein